CGGKGDCHDDHPCITHDLWMGLNAKILSYLEGITLQQLVDGYKSRNSDVSPISVNKTARASKTAA
ncbi:MAG TPA: DNA-binding protein, partial [Gallionella sp.]|nr:DNA-binding protein [Gallionella sp.]